MSAHVDERQVWCQVGIGHSARTLKVAALLSKPSRRLVEIPVDYVGFSIEDHFVVGYGLDYNEKYRNLRDIVVYGS